jgi:hypothetical protein
MRWTSQPASDSCAAALCVSNIGATHRLISGLPLQPTKFRDEDLALTPNTPKIHTAALLFHEDKHCTRTVTTPT